MVKVAIADAHSVMRDGLRAVLEASGDFKVVAEAFDGPSTSEIANTTDAALLTLGLTMPGIHGVELIRLLKNARPSLRILIVTMHAEQLHAIRAFRAGASGYITKDTTAKDFISAIRKVSAGGVYISLAVAEQMAIDMKENSCELPHERLAPRELDVFLRIISGESVTRIADTLTVSVQTVSTQKARILDKLGMSNTATLVRYAQRHHLFPDDGLEDKLIADERRDQNFTPESTNKTTGLADSTPVPL